MNAFTIPDRTQPDAVQIADGLLNTANQTIADQIRTQADAHAAFWDNPKATPAELLASMGTSATQFLQLAWCNVENIARVANVLGVTPAFDGTQEATVAIVAQVMPLTSVLPRQSFTYNQDGSVEIAE